MVVVGSGIAGATVALGLARRGVPVTVVDDAREGRATAAGAGIVQPWSSSATGEFAELYARGATFYPGFVDDLLALTEQRAEAIGYARTGSLVVSSDPDDIDAVVARLAERRERWPEMGDVTRLSSAELVAAFPPLRGGLDGVSVAGGARVDGRLLTAAVLRAVERLGGRVRVGTVHVGSDPRHVSVDGEALAADAVVVASGAWTARLLEPVPVAVEPQRGQIVHLRLEGVDTSPWPTVTPVAHHYLVPFADGRVVAGATRETGSGFDPRVTAEGLRQVLADALTLAPGLGAATVIETRVGLRPLPTRELPTFGPLPGRLDVFVATGYGAAGLTMAPLLGDAVAEQVAGGTPPFALLGP